MSETTLRSVHASQSSVLDNNVISMEEYLERKIDQEIQRRIRQIEGRVSRCVELIQELRSNSDDS